MVDLQYICPFNSLLIELRSILGGTSALLKRAWHCFNGLYTPFGSPVIGGQKRLFVMFASLFLDKTPS